MPTPGFAYGLSGTDLAGRASQQAWLLDTEFVLINSVEALDTDGASVHRYIETSRQPGEPGRR